MHIMQGQLLTSLTNFTEARCEATLEPRKRLIDSFQTGSGQTLFLQKCRNIP